MASFLSPGELLDSSDSTGRKAGQQLDGEGAFRVVEYLTRRLDDTLRHSQVSTRNIYLVNGAVLAAIYFTFERQEFGGGWMFVVAAALSMLLAVVNWLHANFLWNQNSWYGAIDAQVREVFLTLGGVREAWPQGLNDFRRDYQVEADKSAHKFEKWARGALPFRRTFWTYPGIHLVMAAFLFVAAILFLVAGYRASLGP